MKFDGVQWVIKSKGSTKLLAHATMATNRMFPLVFCDDTEVALVNNQEMNDADLWHLRYGHLNSNGLQLLKNNEMVSGLPSFKDQKKVCEGSLLGKQAKKAFSVGNSRQATEVWS